MQKIPLNAAAKALPEAWQSQVIGNAASAQIKVLRMDEAAYPAEVHEFAEALLVIDGCMLLDVAGQTQCVRAGELFVVPAGVQHAVAPGSHGTLVIVDAAPSTAS